MTSEFLWGPGTLNWTCQPMRSGWLIFLVASATLPKQEHQKVSDYSTLALSTVSVLSTLPRGISMTTQPEPAQATYWTCTFKKAENTSSSTVSWLIKLTSESPCNTDKWPQATVKHSWIPASPNITPATKPASPKTTQSKSQLHLRLHQETAHLHDYTSKQSQPALGLHQNTESIPSTIISATESALYSITDVKGALSLMTQRGKAGHGFSAKQTWGQHPLQAVSSQRSSPLGEEAELQVLYVPWELNVRDPWAKLRCTTLEPCSPVPTPLADSSRCALPPVLAHILSSNCHESTKGKYRIVRKHPRALMATWHCCILILFNKSAHLPQLEMTKLGPSTTGNFYKYF